MTSTPYVKQLGLLAAVLLLAACSSNPYAIKPNPVPEIASSTYQVESLWDQGVGDGLDDKVGYRLRPAVTSKQVIAADVTGYVASFARKDGDEQWEVDTDYPISSSLYAGYDKVLFGTHNGLAVALSASDGSVLWTHQLSSEILAQPVSNGVLAVYYTQDGNITALNLATGDEEWNYTVTVPSLILRGASTPLIHQGIVYVGLASGKVIALNIADGTAVWDTRIARPSGRSQLDRLVDVDNNLIFNQGGLFASSYQGAVVVMGAKSGNVFWKTDVSTYTPMSSDMGLLYIATDEGDIRAINQRNGAPVWTQNALHGRHLTAALIQNGKVVTGDYEGWLYWLDTTDGKLLAKAHAADAFAGAPVVYDDTLYVLSADGELSAWQIKPKTDDGFWFF